jgi:hypothetical protein
MRPAAELLPGGLPGAFSGCPAARKFPSYFIGAPEEIRTPDPQIRSPGGLSTKARLDANPNGQGQALRTTAGG